ncbi:MAG TPA: lipopolysaccharide kinase InaA family protein [Methanomassiliicoccales archaeon]
MTEEEREEIVAYAVSNVPKEGIHSLYAFGPKVAGYGTDTSSYDLVIVTKGLPNIEADPKGTKPDAHSYILVEEKELLAAVDGGGSGEKALSNLLNIYEPLVNQEFIRQVELSYKRRIIAEVLFELQSDYDDLSSNFIIPYEYFLFDKLHKMALAHPDEVEGYVRTYSGARKERNLTFALKGFQEASEKLAAQAVIDRSNDSVRIPGGRVKRLEALDDLGKLYPQTAKEMTRNTLHSSASKVGIQPKTQPIPEASIHQKIWTMVELERPKKLLRLEEGVVFDDASKMIEELAQINGFAGAYEHEEKKMGDFTNSSKGLEIKGGGRQAKFIMKPFPELKSAKWFILNIWSLAAKSFNMAPLSRLNREIEAVTRLRGLGIRTHRIAGIILEDRTLVTEYTEGTPLDRYVQEIFEGKSTDTGHIEEYARVLGKMHRAGMVYGDTKPANALIGKDGLYLLDLEQAEEGGDKAWDLAEFLYYSARSAEKEAGMKLVADSFLAAYREQNGSQTIAKARKIRYMNPFLIFVKRKMRRVVRESLERHSSPDIQQRRVLES